jgi:hypothetical protein
MSDAAVIAGAEAWAKVHKATTFEAWKAISLAVVIGRQHALRSAGINHPHGTRYSRAYIAWLNENGFASLPFGLRASCCKLADNMTTIEQWRASLTDAERQSQNNPQTVLKNWRRATRLAEPLRRRVTPHAANGDRPVQASGDLIKRVAIALRAVRSNDYFVMARAALDALTHADLVGILDEPPRGRQPRKVAAPEPAHA